MGATIYTAYRNHSRFYLTWSEGGQDISNNRTLIHWTVGVQGEPGWTAYWYSNAIRLNSAYIDGQGNLGSGTWSNITLVNGATVPLRSGSIWVGHNSDGTKGFNATVHGWFYGNGDVTAEGSWNIATIPRNSQVTTNNSGAYDLGSALTIFTNRKSSSFTHLIRIRHNNSSGTLIHEVNGITDTAVWTPSGAQITQMQNLIPSSNSIVLNIGQYNNQVGQWSYVNVTAYLRNANPTFLDFDYRDSNTATTAITGDDQILVKGKSVLEVTVPVADKMVAIKGASSDRYSIVYDGVTIQQPYSDDADIIANFTQISSMGQRTVIATAFDSRNNNTSVSKQVTVYDYTAPTIEATIERENNFGTDTTISLQGGWNTLTINSVDKNSLTAGTLRYRYKEDGGSFGSWSNRTFTTDGSTWEMTSDFVLSLDNTKKYVFEFNIADRFETVTTTANIDVGKPILFVGENDGEAAIGIGKMPENGALDVDGDIYSNGNKIIVGGWDEIARITGAIDATGISDTFTAYKYIRVEVLSRQTGTQTTQNVLRMQFNGVTGATGYYRATSRITEVPAIAFSTGDADSIIVGITNGLHQQSISEYSVNGLGSATTNHIGTWSTSSDEGTWRFATGRYTIRSSSDLTSVKLYSVGTTYDAELIVYGHN